MGSSDSYFKILGLTGVSREPPRWDMGPRTVASAARAAPAIPAPVSEGSAHNLEAERERYGSL